MPFNEKSAWIMSLALIVGGIGYFGTVLSLSGDSGVLAPPSLPAVGVYTATLIVVAIVGHALIAGINPKGSDGAVDERERRIVERSGHQSGYVLGAGVLAALLLYVVSHDGNTLFYAVFASLMLARIAEYALRIYYYRTSI